MFEVGIEQKEWDIEKPGRGTEAALAAAVKVLQKARWP